MKGTHLLIISFLLFIAVSLYGQTGLTHRWNFSDNTANDSIGNANATLINNTGNSYIASGELTLLNDGSQFSDANNGDYLDLPDGIISVNGNQATFERWVTWTISADWQAVG